MPASRSCLLGNFALLFIFVGLAYAQQSARIYLPNLADEEWGFLQDPAFRTDFWDPLKYVPLGKEDWYLSLGGEARLSPQGFFIRKAESAASIRDAYLLQRYLFSVDLRMGKRFRVFGEIQSGLISGKLLSPRPTDKNVLDVHQAFVQYSSNKAPVDGRTVIRIGRQELTIGSSRLIAASQGLNVKRSFDGISGRHSRGKWAAAGAVARLVKIVPGAFDDPPDPAQDFWGVAVVRRHTMVSGSTLGAYYLGVDRKLSQYAQGIGPESRHTFGLKIAGSAGRFDVNNDLIVQAGTFAGLPVRAWAVSSSTGYRVGSGKIRPRISISLNAASGDADPNDQRLESFNPLFPGTSFSGIVGLFGPTNLFDVTPSIQAPLRRNLLLAFESPFYTRMSSGDGLYAIDLRLLIPPGSNKALYVGANPGIIVSWQPYPHVGIVGAVTRFLPGAFLSDSIVAGGFSFYSTAITYRF